MKIYRSILDMMNIVYYIDVLYKRFCQAEAHQNCLQ